MIGIPHLLELVEAFKEAAGVNFDHTLSFRVFRDSKKIRALKSGGDITITRFNSAIFWFRDNCPPGPEGDELRRLLTRFAPPQKQADAA